MGLEGIVSKRKTSSYRSGRAAVGPHAVAVLAGDDAEAVVLDLVQPSLTGWRLLRFVGRQGGTKPAGNRMYIAA